MQFNEKAVTKFELRLQEELSLKLSLQLAQIMCSLTLARHFEPSDLTIDREALASAKQGTTFSF